MGREFLDIFSGWAKEYDAFVEGKDEEYQAVFDGYEEILDEIVHRSGDKVIEFGIGTGNLTQKLVHVGKTVFPIEPSEEMRAIAKEKLPSTVDIYNGDMQNFPKPDFPVDTIVSSYVFHHLNDREKMDALQEYTRLLEEGGKVIFADTLFISQEVFDQVVNEAKDNGYDNLAEDLEREYYPLFETMYHAYMDAGLKKITFKQMNEFVWIIEGQKR